MRLSTSSCVGTTIICCFFSVALVEVLAFGPDHFMAKLSSAPIGLIVAVVILLLASILMICQPLPILLIYNAVTLNTLTAVKRAIAWDPNDRAVNTIGFSFFFTAMVTMILLIVPGAEASWPLGPKLFGILSVALLITGATLGHVFAPPQEDISAK